MPRCTRSLTIAALVLVVRPSSALGPPGPFLEPPYLQLGSDAPALDSLSLLWHTEDRDGAWSV